MRQHRKNRSTEEIKDWKFSAKHIVNSWKRLDQLEEQNLLSHVGDNHRVGSGGPGITDELPQKDFNPKHVRPIDQWGSSTAQIFSEVSPEMHEEFALKYEIRWMERFGLNYYGCCEANDLKFEHIIKHIPNLRAIAVSPWVKHEAAVEEKQDKYVYSWKPNPTDMIAAFNEDFIRSEMKRVFEITKKCYVAVALRDTQTLYGEPERLTKWTKITKEAAIEYQ